MPAHFNSRELCHPLYSSSEYSSITHLVGLLRVGRALGHDHQGGPPRGPSHGSDVEALLPPLHDPVLGQEVHAAELVHLQGSGQR